MIRYEVALDIDRPVAEVFGFLEDVSRTPRWLARCVELTQTSPGPRAVGATLRYVYREGGRTGEMAGKVTAYERNAKLGFAYSDAMFDVSIGFEVRPAGAGTRVEHRIAIAPKTLIARLLSPMIRRQVRKNTDRDTAKLKAVVE